MQYELRQLSVDNGHDEYHMLQTIDALEYGFTNPVNGMQYDEYKNWLIKEDNISKSLNLPENWIPQTTYFLYVNNQPVGIARIRHYASEMLEKQGVGNLGYGIGKPHRGKGYGHILFREVLQKCKEMGYTKIRSFVYIENTASNQIFIKNGAQFVGVFDGVKNIYETSL